MLSHHLLSDSARLHFEADACLAVRSAGTACRVCETVCPAAALSIADVPQLTAACLGCGRCAGVCPTGALTALSVTEARPLPNGDEPIRIECWMVPPAHSHHNSLRVPCAGAVSPGRWVAWVEAAEPARLEVVDRGWCETCPAGGGDGHVAMPVLATVREWLCTAGMPAANQPRIVTKPLAANLRLTEFPRPADAEPLGRRDFFHRVTERFLATEALPATHHTSIAAIRQTAHAQPEHALRLAVLTRSAERHGGSVHPAVQPSITLDDSCANHGVCAGVCPTGALRLVSGSVAEGLAFDGTLCTACGQCERLCPTQAIHLDLDRCGPAGFTLISRHELNACPECGTAHTGSAPLCPRCATGRDMAFDLFSPAGPSRRNSQSSAEVTHHE